jgi:hypothetical protein
MSMVLEHLYQKAKAVTTLTVNVNRGDNMTVGERFERIKNFFKERGEGTAWDLDYGKLIIIGLCIYIAVNV